MFHFRFVGVVRGTNCSNHNTQHIRSITISLYKQTQRCLCDNELNDRNDIIVIDHALLINDSTQSHVNKKLGECFWLISAL